MYTLYYAPGASSMAAHIALHEVGAAFEGRPLSFSRNEQRTDAYLALNPEGKVPTLLIDERRLTEVAAILYFLARRHPEAGLLPAGIEAEAQTISWMSFIASTLHPARRSGVDAVMKAYGIADRKLGAKAWAVDSYSIADIHLFRLYWRIANSLKPAPGTFPNLTQHYGRMMARPAVQRTLEIERADGYELPG